MTNTLRTAVLLAALPLGTACDGNGDEDNADSAAAADDSSSERVCEGETRDDFAIGLTRDGATVAVSIADAMPADPIRGDNGWVLMITQDSAAMDDVGIKIKPWMPDHGHGTPVEAVVTPRGDGEYMLEPLNLFMPGLWEVTFELTLADGTTDEVMFSACVQ
ncbi:MAG: FixH family protein [Myxococcota bacterium]